MAASTPTASVLQRRSNENCTETHIILRDLDLTLSLLLYLSLPIYSFVTMPSVLLKTCTLPTTSFPNALSYINLQRKLLQLVNWNRPNWNLNCTKRTVTDGTYHREHGKTNQNASCGQQNEKTYLMFNKWFNKTNNIHLSSCYTIQRNAMKTRKRRSTNTIRTDKSLKSLGCWIK